MKIIQSPSKLIDNVDIGELLVKQVEQKKSSEKESGFDITSDLTANFIVESPVEGGCEPNQ